MKITNRLALPLPIVQAVTNDGYVSGRSGDVPHIGVTRLLSPPRLVALEEQHADELEEDAADRIWALIGQAVHVILERAESSAITEERVSRMVEGWEVAGRIDHLALLPDGVLTDWKVSSVWSAKDLRDGGKKEWRDQVRLYAHLLRPRYDVRRAQIVTILRDWSLNGARRFGNSYPAHQVVVVDIPLWPADEAERFLVERVRLHQAARHDLPRCSRDERWQRPEQWALMKRGRKAAVRLYDDAESAARAANRVDGVYVQYRPGEPVRCLSYCPVSKWCTQFAESRAAEVGDGEDLEPALRASLGEA